MVQTIRTTGLLFAFAVTCFATAVSSSAGDPNPIAEGEGGDSGPTLERPGPTVLTNAYCAEFPGYTATVDTYGRITGVRMGSTLVVPRTHLVASPSDKSTSILHGYTKCLDKVAVPTQLTVEEGKVVVTREGVWGNEKHPELLQYRYEGILEKEGRITIRYELKSLKEMSWRVAPRASVVVPHGVVAGHGWLVETDTGGMKTGTNPATYKREELLKWVHCPGGTIAAWMDSPHGLIEVRPIAGKILGGYTGKSDAGFFVAASPKTGEEATVGLTVKLPVGYVGP